MGGLIHDEDVRAANLLEAQARAVELFTVVGQGVNTKVTASAILVNPGGVIGNVD